MNCGGYYRDSPDWIKNKQYQILSIKAIIVAFNAL